jgi:hypothetical protein
MPAVTPLLLLLLPQLFPILLSEFGSALNERTELDCFTSITNYLTSTGMANDGRHAPIQSWFYWAWNAETAITGGLVADNLIDIEWAKIAALTGGTNEWPLGLGLRPWYLQVGGSHTPACSSWGSCSASQQYCPHMQGFGDINGTSAVPNSDIPAWVFSAAQKSGSGGSSSDGSAGQSVDVPNRFTIPVQQGGDVSGTNPFSAGQQQQPQQQIGGGTTASGQGANTGAAAPGSGGSSGRKLSGGQIAGATIGSLAGAALLAAASYYAVQKLRPAKADAPETMATFNQAFNSAA